MAVVRYFKIILPGLPDEGGIELMSAEQAESLPSVILHGILGVKLSRYGDLTLLTIEGAGRFCLEIQRSVQWIIYGEEAQFLKHDDLTISQDDGMAVLYDPNTHSADLSFTTTKETHDIFRSRVELLIFAIKTGIPGLKSLLSRQIASFQYPVYAKDLALLLSELAAKDIPNDVDTVDPDLARFISERVVLLHDQMLAFENFWPTLQKLLNPDQLFVSMARITRHVNADKVHEAIALLCESVHENLGGDAAKEVFLEAFADNFRRGGGSMTPINNDGLASPEQSNRAVSVPRGDSANVVSNESNNVIVPKTKKGQKHKRAYKPHSATTGLAGLNAMTIASHGLRVRRPRPEDIHDKAGSGRPRVKYIRPTIDGEYWSVDPKSWDEMSHSRKVVWTNAGLMCETDLGKTLSEPCDFCKERGVTWDMYADDAGVLRATETCAHCRIRGVPCSLVSKQGNGMGG